MWKWMVEFLRKFLGRGIKIDSSIRVAKPLILLIILRAVVAKWRHHELSLSLRWVCIYFS